MSAINSISTKNLLRLIGTPKSPRIIDVRTDEDFNEFPYVIPTAVRRQYTDVTSWAEEFGDSDAVVICHRGLKLSQGVAAWLRQFGCRAELLDGGSVAWQAAKFPAIPADRLPIPNARGQTVWVTRARPKVDRIACPWLIRRFIDPNAAFLFVAPAEVEAVAARFDAIPFDVEGTEFSHRDGSCTFDAILSHFALDTHEPLSELAAIVRGADSGRLSETPQSAGLLAISLGLSRLYPEDLEQLESGMSIYDALYRWCRDAMDETHDQGSHRARGRTVE